MSSTTRFYAALSIGLFSVIGLVGCSGSSSSALATASPGSVPQIGQVVATTALSSGGHEASQCGGVNDATRDALQASARERGWTVDRFSADDQGSLEDRGDEGSGADRPTHAGRESEVIDRITAGEGCCCHPIDELVSQVRLGRGDPNQARCQAQATTISTRFLVSARGI